MRKCFILIQCLFGFLLAQHLYRPVTAPITSDYGPRNRDNGDYDFHHGIDYGCDIWTDVQAVEGGAITSIDYQARYGAGYYIRIQGDSAYWTYMHLFKDVFINTFYDDSINLLSLNFVLDFFS